MNMRNIIKIVIPALCFVLMVISFISRSRQRAAFDDSDLIFSRPNIPVESNAFWTLLKATNQLYWPQARETKLGDLSNNTNWDDKLASEVLSKNQACLDLFDESMRQPFFLIPEPKNFFDDDSYLSGWRAISRVESIRAIALFRANNEKDAFDAAMKIIRFGERVENSGGYIIHYLVGSSIKTSGLLRIQQMTAQTSMKETDLSELIRELDGFKINKRGLINALKNEYQAQSKYLDDYSAGITPMNTNTGLKQIAFSVGIKPFFNITKTKMEFAQSTRALRDNISKPFGEISWSDFPKMKTNVSTWERLITGNAMGDILFEMLEPSLKSIATRKSREDVNVTATQLLLALKIYKLRHDKLPESLSELVPEFFPEIPNDDFDGKPFRYLPDKKIIYSVGPDLKDSGGEARHKRSETYDLPFEIEF